MNDEAPAPDTPAIAAAAMTPMMAQYFEAKRAHPGCLLFFRMGDFYELFFEDAAAASRALDLTLTKRGQHAGADIPMCGVPVHSVDGYLARLIRAGFKVGICEQVEDAADAKKRGGKSLVKRSVTRVVTAGTITEDTLLDARAANYLAALAEASGAMALALLDVSTGDFAIEPMEPARLPAALARHQPGEILVADKLAARADVAPHLESWRAALTPLPAARFDSENGKRRLLALYGVAALDGFGAFGRAECAAGGALVDYVELTQKALPRVAPPRLVSPSGVMEIDPATRRNLELERTLTGERAGSLLGLIDRTVTPTGARRLQRHLAAPVTEPAAIARRLDMVAWFAGDSRRTSGFRAALKGLGDIERALSRLTLGRGGPRDLAGLRDALGATPRLKQILGENAAPMPEGVAQAIAGMGTHDVLVDRLARALAPDLPLDARDGGFIASGYLKDLDDLLELRDQSRKLIAGLQARYADAAKVAGLKVKHNNVLGYFIEVTQLHADKLRKEDGFIHRQTMAGAMRFTTVELSDLETRILNAADKALKLELELFADLVAEVRARTEEIARAAQAIAALDVAAALADLALERNYCRPAVDDSTAFAIEGGRHPVVEAAVAASGAGAFVPNDCGLDAAAQDGARLWLLTGPNMAGKSTFLRQNALIAILAQIGSFVPATRARIGVIDRLFSRVGAADDLARGRSTFMVEMVETAAILNRASARAFVILDEIGRGTATFDGLSIAWAVIEHLHEANRCRALFATHYHELTALAARLAGLSCRTMRVKEFQGDVVFLHEVAPGTADRSYGIHVGQLAGLPAAVIARAEEVLKALEQGGEAQTVAKLADDLPLFRGTRPESHRPSAAPAPLVEALRAVNPDELSPREALEQLYKLRGLLER
jgi:DNA mismatch repair protein MutS